MRSQMKPNNRATSGVRLPARQAGAAAIAIMAIVLGGAATGSAIGATSIKTRSDHAYTKPATPMLGQPTARLASAPPDHYPIDTPGGRYEVYELRDRGLYRNARFGSGDRFGGETPRYAEAAVYETAYEPVVVPIERDPGVRAADTTATPPAARPEARVARAELRTNTTASFVTVTSGNARSVATINVSAQQRASTEPLEPLFESPGPRAATAIGGD